MTPFLEAMVSAKLYPISRVRRIYDTVQKREKECALLLQRSTRKSMATRAPNVKIAKGNYYYVAPAAIGTPVFKRSGRAYNLVGYRADKTSITLEVTVWVNTYGHEKSGRHPALTTVWEKAGPILQRILAGTTSAPQYVEIPASKERKAASVKLGKMDLNTAIKQTLNLSTGIGQAPVKGRVGGPLGGLADPASGPMKQASTPAAEPLGRWNFRQMTPAQRSEYARRAARVRWGGKH